MQSLNTPYSLTEELNPQQQYFSLVTLYPNHKTKLEQYYVLHSLSQSSRKKEKRDLLLIIFGNRQRQKTHINDLHKRSEMTESEICLIVAMMQNLLFDTGRPNLDVA